MLGVGVGAWGLTTWLVAQEAIPVEGLAEKGVLGILVVGLTWLLWQFLKQQRQDLLDERAAHKAEREAHAATRQQTAEMLKDATRVLEANRDDRQQLADWLVDARQLLGKLSEWLTEAKQLLAKLGRRRAP